MNIVNAIKYALQTDAGQKALTRKPIHKYGVGPIWQSNQMALAMQKAVKS